MCKPRCTMWNMISAAILLAATPGFLSTHSLAQEVVKASFQNGTSGYGGTFDRRISSRVGDESNGADSASYFLDGYSSSGNGSPDTQGLIRFDEIFGDGVGQIPEGATILGAELTLHTSLAGNAQTSGPYGVSGLLEPFDELTVYEDFEANLDSEPFSRGAWWQDESATRPVGGFGFQLPGTPDTANVTPLVQAWSDGSLNNNGFVIQAGRNEIDADRINTSDGWSIRTTGFPTASTRPMLEVEYTTANIVMNSFADSTMAIVRSGTSAVVEDTDDLVRPEMTEDGFDLDQTFLDGVLFSDVDGNTSSPDDFALLRFDGVFGDGEGMAPASVPVARAWAVLTTGDTNNNAHTSGPWSAHTVLRDWDTDSLHSSFGDINGLQVEDADISSELDSQDGFIRGAEVWFDVTDYLEGVRTGEDDFGIAVLSKRTADGWMIHTNGSEEETARPRLVVYSGETGAGIISQDCNGDGMVDALDLACVHLSDDPTGSLDFVLEQIPSLPGDLDGNGLVEFDDFLTLSGNFGLDNDAAPAYTSGNIDMQGGVDFDDFLTLSGNFGQTAATAAVPEPATGLLLAIAGLVTVSFRKRRLA